MKKTARYAGRIAMPLLLVTILLAWFNPFAQKQTVDPAGWVQLIPSDRIDSRVELQKANNNLDVTRFGDRYFIAFRTAPSHFASKKTRLYVISSADLITWDFEEMIHIGADMREPRFAVYGDSLRLYFFEAGTKAWKFEPQHIWTKTYISKGRWTDKRSIGLDGYVNWRLRTRSDTLYLSAYFGTDLYNSNHTGNQRLFYSTDGVSFTPVSEESQVPGTGAEEGEFIFDDKGDLWGTVRMEGDGAMVVHAKANDLGKWETSYTTHKYDSALLFEHDGEIYLVSRRNLDGESKKGNWRLYNLLRYSLTRKKTALFHLNKDKMSLDWIMDFPSTGDTAFPGIVSLGNGHFFLLNYSSDIYGDEKNWIRGQLGNTNIYYTLLDMNEITKNNVR